MEGRTLKKLRTMLEAQGFRGVLLYPAKGHWRSSVYADVFRWEGKGVTSGRKDFVDGASVTFVSWDTMTECIRRGIEIQREGSMRVRGMGGSCFDVSSKTEN